MEIVGAKYKSYAGSAINILFAVGEALAGVVAYYVRDWRPYQYATAAILFVIAIATVFAPESPRCGHEKGFFVDFVPGSGTKKG